MKSIVSVFVFVLNGEYLCLCWMVSVFVFHRNKHFKYCYRPGAEGDIWSEDRGSSRWWTKLHSGKLHDLYWWVNNGGEWTERQWDRWDKRNKLEKLKINKKFQLETLRVKGTLGNLGLDEMLKTRWWIGHKGLQFVLPSVKLNTNSSCAIQDLLMGKEVSEDWNFFKDLQN